LVNRLVDPGQAVPAALALATELAELPQVCLRNDRRSLLAQWGSEEEQAMAREAQLGRATIDSGETAAGALRFAAGAGRHGGPVTGS
jgi:enoyl-CoA hydratase